MNTPTTDEINAVLDPLILTISNKYPAYLASVERRRAHNGDVCWAAYSGQLGFSGSAETPEAAVEKLVNGALERTAKRKAEIEAELEQLNAELAKLSAAQPKENTP